MTKSPTGLKQTFIQALSPLYESAEAAAMFRILESDHKDPEVLSERVAALLPDLMRGRPFQYVTGEAWFYGMSFKVNESVLIPRPETEELVHRIIQDIKSRLENTGPIRIIDIGTGSGCIALTLKKHLPDAIIYALDISGEALQVARENASRLDLEINFVEADILEWEFIFGEPMGFDVVVSNPPYITPVEKTAMARHVLDYEPDLALFVPAESPLLFYQHIADFARHHFAENGKLHLEINKDYSLKINELLSKKYFTDIQCFQDMQGLDRMVTAAWNNLKKPI